MTVLHLAGVAALTLAAGCTAYQPPPPGAPLCSSGDGNIYVDEGAVAPCRLSPGQRYVIRINRGSRTSDNLRYVCLGPWGGLEFIVNSGPYDYCVLGR